MSKLESSDTSSDCTGADVYSCGETLIFGDACRYCRVSKHFDEPPSQLHIVEHIPNEILARIFDQLSWPDMVQCRQVCSKFSDLVTASKEWQQFEKEHAVLRSKTMTVGDIISALSVFPPDTPAITSHVTASGYSLLQYIPSVMFLERNNWRALDNGVILPWDDAKTKENVTADGYHFKDMLPVVCLN